MSLSFLCIKFSYLCLRQRINRLKLHKNIRDAGSFVVCIWCYKVLSNCYSCKRFMFTLCFGPADSHWVAALERTNCCHFWIQVWSFRTPAVLCHWNCSSSDFLSPFCTTVSTARSSSSCFTILPKTHWGGSFLMIGLTAFQDHLCILNNTDLKTGTAKTCKLLPTV